MISFFTQDITYVIKNRDELRELNYLTGCHNAIIFLFICL